MKINSIFKNGITMILLLVLIVSCNDKKKSSDIKKETTKEEIDVSKTKQNDQVVKKALNTLNTSYYDNTGMFFREIWVPTERLNGQRDTNFDLKLISQRDISKYGNNIIFEIYKNGDPKKEIMVSNLVKQNDSWNLKDIAKNEDTIQKLNLSSKNSIYIISYRDEDYPYKDTTINNAIDNYIQLTIKKCVDSSGTDCYNLILEAEIRNIIDSNIIDKTKPNTIGGGVIPPK